MGRPRGLVTSAARGLSDMARQISGEGEPAHAVLPQMNGLTLQ
jgi:hypothetical protein